MIRHFFTWQFARFLGVGGLAAFLHWLARVGFSQWLPFGVAVPCAYCVGMAVAFTLNTLFVFPNSDRPRHLQVRDFVFINVAFLPVVWLASVALLRGLRGLGLSWHAEELAHAMAIPIPMLATFLFYKFFAFRENRA